MSQPRRGETLAQAGRAATVDAPRRTWHIVEAAAIGDEIRDEIDRQPERHSADESVQPTDRGSRHADLRRILHSRDLLRQAILMSEILGPPKALRDDSGQTR